MLTGRIHLYRSFSEFKILPMYKRFKKLPLQCKHDRVGAAAVEFAIVAPLFFLFLLGIIDVSRMVMAQTVLVNASREASRVAIIQGSTTAEVEETAVQFAEAGLINGVTVVVNVTQSQFNDTEFVTVTLTVAFDQVSWSGILMVMGDRLITGSTTMRREIY